MKTSKNNRTIKGLALFAGLMLMFGLLSLPVLAAGAPTENDEDVTIDSHDPYKHAKDSYVRQAYGPNTLLIHCEWEYQLPVSFGEKHICQFHEWPLIVMSRPDAYYDGKPKEPYFNWMTMKDYPFGKQYEGFPSDFAEWDGTFTYTGINGTVEYGPTNEAPIGEGTYYVYATVRIPSAVTMFSDGTFILGKTFTIEPSGYKVTFDANSPNSASTTATGTMPELHFNSSVDTRELPPNQFALPGYKFDHWNTKEDDSGVRYENNAYVKDLSYGGRDVTLYARWTPKEYTITYDPGDMAGVSGSPVTEQATFDTPGTLKPVSEMGWTYENRSFLGWTVEGLPLLLGDEGDFVNLCGEPGYGGDPKDVTLTAQWVENGQIKVTTTVDGEPESIASLMTIRQVGSSSTVPIPLYVGSPGEYFAYLSSIPEGNYQLEMESDAFSIPADKQLLEGLSTTSAVSVILDYYTASVRMDDHVASASIRETGTSDPKTEMMVADDTQALISAVVEDGYHFDGYSVLGVKPGNADNTDEFDSAEADQTITVRGKAEITAHAAANVYTVHFDANTEAAVIGEMEDQDMVYDEPQNLFANQFVLNGAVFTGWNTAADGSGMAYTDGQSVENLTAEDGGVVTLYAQWEETPVETALLTFDLAGGTLDDMTGEITVSVNVGDTVVIPGPPTREGHAFKYWEGSRYNPGDSYEVVGDHTFTAVWEQEPAPVPVEKATLTFDLAGGTLGGRTGSFTIEADVGDVVEIPGPPTREGHAFKYWEGSRYNPGDSYEVVGDHTFTAVWEQEPAPVPVEKATLTFDLAGGTLGGRTGSFTIEADVGDVVEIPGPPTREGHAFKYWEGSRYNPGDSYEVVGDHTFTAVWEQEPAPVPVEKATLTFDLAGGTLDGRTGSFTIEADVGDTIKLPAAPTREGYAFKYWEGSRYNPGDSYEVVGDHTFTAVWEKNPSDDDGDEKKPLPSTGDALGTTISTLVATAAGALCLTAIIMLQSHRRSLK